MTLKSRWKIPHIEKEVLWLLLWRCLLVGWCGNTCRELQNWGLSGHKSNQEEVLVRRTEQWNRVLSTWCLYFYFCWCCFLEKWCCLVCLLHGVKGLVPLSFGTSMFWRNIPRQCKHCISIKRKQEKTSLLFQTLNESSSYMRWQIRNIKKKNKKDKIRAPF